MQFTADYFWNTFGSDALDQWAIALSEHNLPADYKEEEYIELFSWVEESHWDTLTQEEVNNSSAFGF